MPDRDDDRPMRRASDQSEFRDVVRELQELSRRVTILETESRIGTAQIKTDIADLRQDVSACATKEQLRPAVWLLGIIGSSGIGAFVLTMWNMIIKRGA